MSKMPSLFISHGSPEMAVRPSPAHNFLSGFAAELPRPRSILVVSAHWETAHPMVASGAAPATVYDFRGFDPQLRLIDYAAPGDPETAKRAADLLKMAGFPTSLDEHRGRDHGVWAPLHLLYPDHEIPVIQVSMQPDADAAYHLRLGRALQPLRDEGVLIIGSGSMTHNLSAFRGQPVDAPVPTWVADFTTWMERELTSTHPETTVAYREAAPFAAENHPEAEHILPLFVALGATLPREPIRRVHASVEHGVLAMDVYRFG